MSRLAEGARQIPHVYRPSTETFVELDVLSIAGKLNLENRGKEAARSSQPESEVGFLDEVEEQILSFITEEQRASYLALVDQAELYEQRLAALDFEGKLGIVESAAVEAAGEFRVQALQGKDQLHALRRDLKTMEGYLERFRIRNRLERPAMYSEAGWLWFKAGLLVLLLAVEMLINGSFLAGGSEFGLMGGFFEALSFAALNILGSAIVATLGIRQIVHRNWGRKLVGLVSLLFYACFIGVLNLALAHYREVAEAGVALDIAGRTVVSRLVQGPFALTDLKSWVLFGLGIAFSLIAVFDVISIDDYYPGYGKADRRLRSRRDAYLSAKDHIIGSLAGVRDAATNAMNEARRDLGVRRSEFDAIADHRQRLLRLYKSHEEHLEDVFNRLLSIYRKAYASALGSKTPERFSQRASLTRTPADEEIRPMEQPTALYRAIEAAQNQLSESLQSIHREYEGAVRELHQLDDLIMETPDAAREAKAQQ